MLLSRFSIVLIDYLRERLDVKVEVPVRSKKLHGSLVDKSAPQRLQSLTAILHSIMIAESDKITFESNLQPTSQVKRGIEQ